MGAAMRGPVSSCCRQIAEETCVFTSGCETMAGSVRHFVSAAVICCDNGERASGSGLRQFGIRDPEQHHKYAHLCPYNSRHESSADRRSFHQHHECIHGQRDGDNVWRDTTKRHWGAQRCGRHATGGDVVSAGAGDWSRECGGHGNIPAAVNEGVVAGATTFTGVDQTVPLGSFVSADGAGGANSQLDVPSVVNGMILDTLATDGTQTVTVSGPQVSRWNVQRGNNTNPGVRGVGSSRTGAPAVPISETFSGTSNWALGAVSINPSTADIGVTTSVSAVPLGQNSTYVITVKNNGPSAAIGATLTDTFAATNLALVTETPSAGTT
jgi:uncharacterized repeat protein (TIGR01451 family)